MALRRAEDPLVGAIAQEYIADREKHDKTAAEWTRRYAQCVTCAACLSALRAAPQRALTRRTPAARAGAEASASTSARRVAAARRAGARRPAAAAFARAPQLRRLASRLTDAQ